jgi:hypothetical protein
VAAANGIKPHASPSIRKFARELGVDLTQVKGSGPKSRITQEDVQGYVKGVIAGGAAAAAAPAPAAKGSGVGLDLLPWPSLDFSRFGATELQPLSRIKKISGPNLHRNWVMIPHVTQYDQADITELEEFRKSANAAMAKSGVKLTMLAFVIKASVAALKKFPVFNSSLDAKGENLILKQYYHIGFAADTPNGLVVPVVKDADKKGVAQIAQEMGRAVGPSPRRQAEASRHAGRELHHLVAGRHRRHGVHAHHQRAGSGDPRPVEVRVQASLGRQAVRAAPDDADLAVLRPPRDRWRDGCPLHGLSVRRAGRHAQDAAVMSRAAGNCNGRPSFGDQQ